MTDSRQDVVPKTLELKTKSGRTFTLHEPSMTDIVDGEKILGKAFLSWFSEEQGIPFDTFGTAIWLAVRKDGLTQQEIKDKAWKLTRDELMDALSLDDCFANLKAVAGFFTPALGEADDPGATSSEPSASESEAGKT